MTESYYWAKSPSSLEKVNRERSEPPNDYTVQSEVNTVKTEQVATEIQAALHLVAEIKRHLENGATVQRDNPDKPVMVIDGNNVYGNLHITYPEPIHLKT